MAVWTRVLTGAALVVPLGGALGLGAGVASAATPTTYVVGTCGTGTTESTIQAAVDAASNGDSIHICAGTYNQQVAVSGKSLTVYGDGAASTFIQASPATDHQTACAPTDVSSTNPAWDLVDLCGGATVDLSGLTVEGPGDGSRGCYGSVNYGVYVLDATLTMHDATVTDIREPASLGGCQVGGDIRVGSNALGKVGHATLTNVTASYGQKDQLDVDGPGSTLAVHNSQILGDGPNTQIAQNGVQAGRGAALTMDGTTLSGFECNVSSACNGDLVNGTQSAAVLVFDLAGATGTTASLDGDTITGSDTGINSDLLTTTPLTVTNTTFTDDRYAGAAVYEGTYSFTGDTFSATAGGGQANGVAVGVLSSDTQPTSVDIESSSFSGQGDAVQTLTDGSTPLPSFSVTGHNDSFATPNADTAGVVNPTSTLEDFTNDYWGSPTGPKTPDDSSVNPSDQYANPLGTGDSVTSNVKFKPFDATAPSAGPVPATPEFPYPVLGLVPVALLGRALIRRQRRRSAAS